MHNRWAWVVAGLLGLGLGSCSERGRQAADAGAGSGAGAGAAAGSGMAKGADRTGAALDAFIKYQAVLLEIDRSLEAEEREQDDAGDRGDRGDGGGAGEVGARDSKQLERLGALARREEEARRRSGLTDQEIEAWEVLVVEVLAAESPRALESVRARHGDGAVNAVLARAETLRQQSNDLQP